MALDLPLKHLGEDKHPEKKELFDRGEVCHHATEENPMDWLVPTPDSSPRGVADTLPPLCAHACVPMYTQSVPMLGVGTHFGVSPPCQLFHSWAETSNKGSSRSTSVGSTEEYYQHDTWHKNGYEVIGGASLAHAPAVLMHALGTTAPATSVPLPVASPTSAWIVPAPMNDPSLMSMSTPGMLASPLPPLPASGVKMSWDETGAKLVAEEAVEERFYWGKANQIQSFFGQLHHFHDEALSSGVLSDDRREFTKTKYMGRLSVITEDKVRTSGLHKYVVQFTRGDLSSADGVGFVFSPKLPCSRNIQKIVSIFVNRAGRICMRAHNAVTRSDVGIKALELGDWIGLTVDLDARIATFTVWPSNGSRLSTASMRFGTNLDNMHGYDRQKVPCTGHFACVVKNAATVIFNS
jgi:hypothetical protein